MGSQNSQLLKKSIQISVATIYNRHPKHYRFISEIVKSIYSHEKGKQINILVFGCSIGLEPLSLVQEHFTESNYLIDAVDISDKALKKAKSINSHKRIEFFNSKFLNKSKKYDVIFANSVFCKHPSPNRLDISKSYPFDMFQDSLGELIDQLKVGGIFMIYNSNYSVSETIFSDSLLDITNSECRNRGFVPLYGKKGKLNFASLESIRCFLFKKIMTDSSNLGFSSEFPSYIPKRYLKDSWTSKLLFKILKKLSFLLFSYGSSIFLRTK